jgi:hypothetical protein
MKPAITLNIVCISIAAIFFAGCERQCVPQITGEIRIPIANQPPQKKLTPEDIEKMAEELGVPAEWIPPKEKEHSWLAIIIHHSATDVGNLAYFNKAHGDRFDDSGEHWLGIGYDFVIGNGTMSGDGEVETTFRWKEQLVGAHCKTNDNWANSYGVGVVLVGNFDQTHPSAKQMESLTKLVSYLQNRYHIPTDDIYGHGETPGAHATACPGKNLSIGDFRRMLAQQLPGPIIE